MWDNCGEGLGIPLDVIRYSHRDEAMLAYSGYLFNAALHRPVEEAVAIINFGVEGMNGELFKRVTDGIKKIAEKSGTALDDKGMEWAEVHRSYDDKHPRQALQFLKRYAKPENRHNILHAARLSMNYFLEGLNQSAMKPLEKNYVGK